MARVQKFSCAGTCRSRPLCTDAWRWGVEYTTEDDRVVWAWSSLVCRNCAHGAADFYRLHGYKTTTSKASDLEVAAAAAYHLGGPTELL